MAEIYTHENLPQLAASSNSKDWTVVIPAAGKGTRLLGYDKPKILFPVGGKTILKHLIDLLSPFCSKLVFVLSKDGEKQVKPLLECYVPEKYEVVIQKEPLGMAHAVLVAKDNVKTPYTLVVWGDQVALRKKTIIHSMKVHEFRKGALLTLPTFWKKNPYIHFEKDRNNKIIRVLQAREKDKMPIEGENDAGLFCFSTEILFKILSDGSLINCLGSETKEYNLLPIIPFFEKGDASVALLRIIDEEETIGINTWEDVSKLSDNS